MSERVSRMDVRDMAMVRRVILTVIDDGWRCGQGCDIRHPWSFNSADEDMGRNDEAYDNEQRLRFCDAIQAAIMKEIGPDEAQLKQIMADTAHLAPIGSES